MANWITLKKSYKPPKDPRLLPELAFANIDFNVDTAQIIHPVTQLLWQVSTISGLALFVDKEGYEQVRFLQKENSKAGSDLHNARHDARGGLLT